MSGKHKPGPWRAVEMEPVAVLSDGRVGAPYWQVLREVGRNFDQTLKNPDGKPARFNTEAEALAAIAKAEGK